jgi:hypothetical protein
MRSSCRITYCRRGRRSWLPWGGMVAHRWERLWWRRLTCGSNGRAAVCVRFQGSMPGVRCESDTGTCAVSVCALVLRVYCVAMGVGAVVTYIIPQANEGCESCDLRYEATYRARVCMQPGGQVEGLVWLDEPRCCTEPHQIHPGWALLVPVGWLWWCLCCHHRPPPGSRLYWCAEGPAATVCLRVCCCRLLSAQWVIVLLLAACLLHRGVCRSVA